MMSISEAEYWDRQWWCLFLITRGGKDAYSVTIQGYPDWDDLNHFGEFVIHNPPFFIDRETI